MSKFNRDVSGIYAIVRIADGAIYVGQAQNCRVRFNQHRHHLRKGTHRNPILQNAWRAHGESAFEMRIIEECVISDLTPREQFHLTNARNEGLKTFNLGDATDCPARGRKFGPMSEENRKKIADALRGRVRSKEHCEAISAAQKGREIPLELRAKWSASRTGKKQTPEHIAKCTQSRIGKKHSPERVAKAQAARAITMAAKGGISEQTREKMRQASLGRRLTDEAKRKCSEASKRWWAEKNRKPQVIA